MPEEGYFSEHIIKIRCIYRKESDRDSFLVVKNERLVVLLI